MAGVYYNAVTLNDMVAAFNRAMASITMRDDIEVEYRIGAYAAGRFDPGLPAARWEALRQALDQLGFRARTETSSYGCTRSNSRVFDDGTLIHKQRLFVVDYRDAPEFGARYQVRLAASREVPLAHTNGEIVRTVQRERHIYTMGPDWEVHMTNVNGGERYDVEVELVSKDFRRVREGYLVLQRIIQLGELIDTVA